MTYSIKQKFGLLVVAVFFFVVLTPTASADCVYQGKQYSSDWCKEFLGANFNNSYQVFYRAGESYPVTKDRYQTVVNPYTTTNYNQQIQFLLQEVARLQALLATQTTNTYYPYTSYTYSNSNRLGVSTNGASSIDRDEVIMRGSVRVSRNQRVDVWFEYGTSQFNLNRTTSRETLDDKDDDNFSSRVSGLYDDTTYYFRAVARDDSGRIEQGSILRFETDDDYYSGNRGRDSDGDEPDVNTGSASNIDNFSARISGSVDMNDFRDGDVYFVFGQDEDQVEDVDSDYDDYNDIEVDGDELDKILVDSHATDRDSYERTIYSLERDTSYYYRICVDFEDDYDDTEMLCGSVREFQTD